MIVDAVPHTVSMTWGCDTAMSATGGGSVGHRLPAMTPDRARLLLEVQPPAAPAQVEDAFRRRAWMAHPDRGGSAEEFARLAEARVVLLATTRDGRSTQQGRSSVMVVPDVGLLRQVVIGASGWAARRGLGRRRGSDTRRVS